MEFARSEFRLSKPGEDGVSMRAKLEKMNSHALYRLPKIPRALEHVWAWFCELNSARTSNGFGSNPITYSEIAAWSALTLNVPTPWEVSLMKRIDRVFLEEMAK